MAASLEAKVQHLFDVAAAFANAAHQEQNDRVADATDRFLLENYRRRSIWIPNGV